MGRILRPMVIVGILGTLVCGLALAALVLSGFPSASEALGPPSSSLDDWDRTLLAGYLLANRSSLDGPAGDPSAVVDLEILEGETAASVAARLAQAGIVARPELLEGYLRYRGLDVSIEVGHFSVSGGMTLRQLAEALQSARPSGSMLTVAEGWRREQIAERLPYDLLTFTAEDFLGETLTTPQGYSFTSALPSPGSLEGFLFPDTYFLELDVTPAEVVKMMLDNFEQKVGADLLQGFSNQGLSLCQAITLASIVEREAAIAEERPLIASVFLNRLKSEMKLEADPTVQYALGRQPDGTWWKAPLSLADLEIDSPYNTYRYPGLPPGPIANPGVSSLSAVALPAETGFLFFRATCDGSRRHTFATTFEEHLQNVCP